ncbi:MAG: histidine kinase, partial [Flavihumibacter sp.]
MKKEIQEISQRIAAYGRGHFDRPLRLSGEDEDFDAIKAGINMLGEELREMMISRDYSNSIFHAVSDMVFLLNGRGTIVEINQSVSEQLLIPASQLVGRSINYLSQKTNRSLLAVIRRQLLQPYSHTGFEYQLSGNAARPLPVLMSVRYMRQNGARSPKQILVAARDMSTKIEAENALLRAVIDTQEKERSRLARDLHDSLVQQLSAIRFYLASTQKEAETARRSKLVARSKKALIEVMDEMRNICFDLMPKTLDEFGLYEAVREACRYNRLPPGVRCQVVPAGGWPRLPAKLEIDLYRIVQEFISNAIRHGEAKRIRFKMEWTAKDISLLLQDDGRGFDQAGISPGMGLRN